MPSSTKHCVDATFVVRMLLDRHDEPVYSRWRAWMRDGDSVHAPALLHYEVVNALYQQQRTGNVSSEVVSLLIQAALVLPIRLHAELEYHVSAHRLAETWSLPATYDAHYLAVAQHGDAALWTSDRRLVNALGGRLPWVRYVPRRDETP